MLSASRCLFGALPSSVGCFHLSLPRPNVCQVTIRNKNKLNLLDDEYFKALQYVMTTVLSEDAAGDVRAAVLTTAEDQAHFTAGLDLKGAMKDLMGETTALSMAKLMASETMGIKTQGKLSEAGGMPSMRGQRLRRVIRQYQDSVSSIARCRVPIVAGVHNMCIGGGIDIITACDFRYATDKSIFSVREAKVGITADIGTLSRLPLIVGQGKTRELAFRAQDITAAEAYKIKLVEEVFPTYDAMIKGSLDAAEEIAHNSPMAVQGTKEMLNFISEQEAQRGLDHVRLYNSAFLKSDDMVEAGVAFRMKRAPLFLEYSIDDRSERASGKGCSTVLPTVAGNGKSEYSSPKAP